MELEQIKGIYKDGHEDGYNYGLERGMLLLSNSLIKILVKHLPDDPVKRYEIHKDVAEAMKKLSSEFSTLSSEE